MFRWEAAVLSKLTHVCPEIFFYIKCLDAERRLVLANCGLLKPKQQHQQQQQQKEGKKEEILNHLFFEYRKSLFIIP